MRIVSDLHIHSRFSRAVSPRMNPACLEKWARIKGIDLLGTGDCTHPVWLAELRENLDDAEPGFFTLKKDALETFASGGYPIVSAENKTTPRFTLTGEICTIYKYGGKTRKLHHLIILPDFETATAFQAKLELWGNIRHDGRPILKIDSRTLLETLLEINEKSLMIPAHIWTPWFSVMGAKSGFDSVEECYRDLVSSIPAVETGLSSDPPMNWAQPSLDRFSIISNSDAHSPDKIGREATIFETEMSYDGLYRAIFPRSQTSAANIAATIEFFPEEGKYHYDGHRKCGVCVNPGADNLRVAACPVCGKPLTRGVMGRVTELAGRPLEKTKKPVTRGNRRPFYSLIPLREILGELLQTGSSSKKVARVYNALIEKAGCAGEKYQLPLDMTANTVLCGLESPSSGMKAIKRGLFYAAIFFFLLHFLSI